MGLETQCQARISGKAISGKLHVDSKELTFTAAGLRWQRALCDATPTVTNGALTFDDATFELGPDAPKWLKKITNPPTLWTKLGLKPGTKLWIGGTAPKHFAADAEAFGAYLAPTLRSAELGIFFFEDRDALPELSALATTLGNKNLWAIYPKGGKTVKEAELFSLGKELGWGVSKSIAFDDRLTAMRFAVKKS